MHDEHESSKDRRLIALLREIPVVPPRRGFARRVLAAAVPARRVHMTWALATAASVAIAVLVTLQFTPGNGGPVPVSETDIVAVDAGAAVPRPVTLVLRSTETLAGATLTIELDDNLELDRYPGIHRLSWQTDLQQGANRLTLPVSLQYGESGEVRVTLVHGEMRKSLNVRVSI